MLTRNNNPHGGDIYRNRVQYDFSANTSPLGTPEAVTEAICRAAKTVNAYPDPLCAALTAELSRYEGLPEPYLICGNGAADLIFGFAAAVRPRKALIVAPTFCEYENAVRAAGGEIEYFLLRAEDDFAPSDAIADAVRPEIDAVFLCNPNNPTGAACPLPVLRRLAQKCAQCGALLFLDECFCDLSRDGDALSFKTELYRYPGVFILKAFTKSYGMAGVRLGYGLCADAALLERMARVSQAWNVSALAQAAGIAALGCGEFLQKNREIIARERGYLTEALRSLGRKTYPGSANFILFESDAPLYEGLLEQGVLIRRCGNFAGLDDRFYRCAIKTHAENEAFVQALSRVLGTKSHN